MFSNALTIHLGQTGTIIDVELIELMIDRVTIDDTERKMHGGFGAVCWPRAIQKD